MALIHFFQEAFMCFSIMTGCLSVEYNRRLLNNNLYFDKYVLREKSVHSESQCAFLCREEEKCLSYNVEYHVQGTHAVKCLLKHEGLDRYTSRGTGMMNVAGQKVNDMQGKVSYSGTAYDQCPFSALSDQATVCPDFPVGGTREQCYSISPNCCWDEDISVTGDVKCYLNDAALTTENNKWTEVYAHQSDGSLIWGSIHSLADHVRLGSHIRIVGDLDDGVQLSIARETVYILENGDICLVTPPDIYKLDLFHIVNNAEHSEEWIYRKICTTGKVEVMKLGFGSTDLQSISTDEMRVRWFAKPLASAGNGSAEPVYSILSDGQTTGSVVELAEAHVKGVPFFPLTSDVETVVSRNIRAHYSTSSNPNGTVRAFAWTMAVDVYQEMVDFLYPNPYVNMEAFLANGNLVVAKWLVSKHQNVEANSVSQRSVTWLLDDRWEIMYKHDADGIQKEGSLNNLVKAIRSGRRIRILAVVYEQEMAFSLETWIVKTEPLTVWAHVTSRNLVTQASGGRHTDQVFANAADGFEELWIWCSTDGYCKVSYIPYAERTTSFTENILRAEQTWLAEKTHSRLVYSVDSTGSSSGTIEDLVDGLSAGGELVIARDYGDHLIYCVPHSYEFNNSSVTVTTTSEYALSYQGGLYKFQQNVYHTLYLYTTDGSYQMLRWYYGGGYLSDTTGQKATYWFLAM